MKKNTTSRRVFLRSCGVIGLGLAAGGISPLTAEAARFKSRPGEKLHQTSQTRMLMGTFVTVNVVHPSRDKGREAVERAFGEMKRLIAIFDRHDGSTPISVLNETGRVDGAPVELTEVANRALRLNGLSFGAFDATIAPLVDLYKLHAGNGMSFSDAEFRDVLELVDSSSVKVQGQRIAFGKSGMGLTLDGIAKGFIVDKASEALTRMGAVNHLVNAGGDIRTSGERDQGRPWKIAVEDPEKRGDYPEVLHVRNCAMATSGVYESFYDEKKIYNHLVSPETGRSPRSVAGVTVTAPTVMEADALSTSVCLMSLDKGIEFIYSLPGRECLILAASGRKMRSKGWNYGA